jgi:DNA mismatch repair protein MutL
MDAGSSEIVVELKGGGCQLIRVQDDGEGIDPEDVPLAIQRYATSKLKRVEDLYDIHTLGFRGEALPSIACISQMTIKTRVAGSISGTRLVCEGGQVKSISEIGCPIGTEIEVKNIFYNLPVKRKFLKSIRTELHYSLSHFLRLSLSHPSISFRFIHDNHILHEHPKTDSPLIRIEAILGKEAYDHLVPCEFEEGEIKVYGFASLPTFSKKASDGIFLFVNRRFIRDRMIYRAIMEAYRHVIPAGKFPVVILFIGLPPSAIDVNVHPTKAEVKFRDQERVFHAVIGALRSIHEPPGLTVSPQLEGQRKEESDIPVGQIYTYFKKTNLISGLGLEGKGHEIASWVREELTPEWKGEEKRSIRILGQVQNTYLICESGDGVIFIDQHAAHERILYETYKSQYEKEKIVSERFLIPVPIEISPTESLLLETYLEEFQKMGFEIEPMDNQTYVVRSIPSYIDPKDLKEVIGEILDEWSFLKKERKGIEPIQSILITLACHSAIRGNFGMRREEMEELVKTLAPFNMTATCPHGRPIFFILKWDEMDKQFRRKPQSPKKPK